MPTSSNYYRCKCILTNYISQKPGNDVNRLVYHSPPPPKRKCKRPNYMPHVMKIKNNYYDWKDVYTPPLRDIYRLIRGIMQSRFPNYDIDWEDPTLLGCLVKFIYRCSSTYIFSNLRE